MPRSKQSFSLAGIALAVSFCGVDSETSNLRGQQRLAPTLSALVAADASGGVAVRAALDRVGGMGFRFVQLSATQPGMRPRDLDRSARRDLLAALRRRELGVAGLDAWVAPQHFVDAQQVDRAVGAIQQAIELAADLGRCAVSFTLGTPPDSENRGTTALQPVVEALAQHADRFGVRLADHAVPVADRDSPLLGVGIDPATWLSQSADPAAAIMASAARLVSVRLCDLLTSGLRGPIGDPQEAQLNVLEYKVALSVANYTGPLVVDARQWTDPWTGLARTRSTWLAL